MEDSERKVEDGEENVEDSENKVENGKEGGIEIEERIGDGIEEIELIFVEVKEEVVEENI